MTVLGLAALATSVQAKNVYVDDSATGSGDGTSMADAFTSIQAAIDDAGTVAGDVIVIADGTYSESVNLNKAVHLDGAGDTTVLSGASGNGITVDAGGNSMADRLMIKELAVTGFNVGVLFPGGTDHVYLDDLVLTGNNNQGVLVNGEVNDLYLNEIDASGIGADNTSGIGFYVTSGGDIDGLTVMGGDFSDNEYGIYTATSAVGGPFDTDVVNVLIKGSTFINCGSRGMYIEKLSQAVIDGILVQDCGLDPTIGKHGISLNLKNGAHENIAICNSTITNSGGGSFVNYGFGLLIRSRLDESPLNSVNFVRVYDNNITGNPVTAIGVEAESPVPSTPTDPGPTLVFLRGNNLSGNLGTAADTAAGGLYYAQGAFLGTPIDARGNYWGTGGPDSALLAPPTFATLSTQGVKDPIYGTELAIDPTGPSIVSFDIDPNPLDGTNLNQLIVFEPFLPAASGNGPIQVDPAYAGSNLGDSVDGGTFGQNRFDKVEEALAVNKGDTVTLADGTYNSEWIVIDRPVTLTGSSPTSVTIQARAQDGVGFTDYTALIVMPPCENAGITIENIGMATNPAVSPALTGALFAQAGVDSTAVNGNNRATLTNLTIDNTVVTGTLGGFNIKPNLSGLEVTNSTFNGVVGFKAIEVQNSLSTNPGPIASDILISGNTITNGDGTGIMVADFQNSGDGEITDVEISNNTITNNQYSTTVAGNPTITSGNNGASIIARVSVKDLSIVDNTIANNNNQTGIFIDGAGDADSNFDGLLITGNDVSGLTGYDLYSGGSFDTGHPAAAVRFKGVRSADNHLVRYNLISGNAAGARNTTGAQDVAMRATINWWGAADGPSGSGPGTGDSITNNIIIAPHLVTESYDPTADVSGDGDLDGVSDDLEAAIGTNAGEGDTDGDSYRDGIELLVFTDPLTASVIVDSDNDGLPDSIDNSPNNPDADGDGYGDGYEVLFGFDPEDAGDSPTLGDVNATPGVSFDDGLDVLRYFLGITGSLDNPQNADVNLDGSIDNVDGVIIIQRFLGNITTLPLRL